MSNQTSIELQKRWSYTDALCDPVSEKKHWLTDAGRWDGTSSNPESFIRTYAAGFSDTGADVDLAKNRTDAVTYKTAGNNRCNPSGATLKQRSGSD